MSTGVHERGDGDIVRWSDMVEGSLLVSFHRSPLSGLSTCRATYVCSTCEDMVQRIDQNTTPSMDQGQRGVGEWPLNLLS